MSYYFKMYENDLENFYLPMTNSGKYGLPMGLIEVAFGPVIRSFSCTIIKENIDITNKNNNTVIIEIEQNIDKETNNRTIILVPKDYPKSDKIKVHLVNYSDEAYIDLDYNFRNETKENKVKYYFALNKEQQNKFIKYNNDVNFIIMMNWANSDRDLFKIKNIKDEHLKDYKIYSILIDPKQFHVGKDFCNGYQKQIYKSFIDEEFNTIKFFTTINDVYNLLNTISNVREWIHCNDKKYTYAEADATNMAKLYEERKMTIKDIKVNGPATIVFWADNTKTIVKCQKADTFDMEKGIVMALVKGIFQKYKGTNNWTKPFEIPYANEIDVEKVIGLALLRDHYGYFMKDPEWHYNYVLKWVYKNKGYKIEDEIAALKALGYSDERIKKCLKTNLGVIRNALSSDTVYKKEQKIYATLKSKSEDNYITNKSDLNYSSLNELKKDLKTEEKETQQASIITLFNAGYSVAKIAKQLGMTEYFVKKYLDASTDPKISKSKAERILKKAKKEKITHKKHVLRTEIEFPDYLDKEECEKILAATKLKYADNPRINCMSELQKFFIRECKIYKIKQLYGKNGYSMYEIAQIIGTTAAGVQKMYNGHKEEIES